MKQIILLYSTTDRYTIKICNRIKKIIEKKDNAFFSVNIVAKKVNKNTPETNPY